MNTCVLLCVYLHSFVLMCNASLLWCSLNNTGTRWTRAEIEAKMSCQNVTKYLQHCSEMTTSECMIVYERPNCSGSSTKLQPLNQCEGVFQKVIVNEQNFKLGIRSFRLCRAEEQTARLDLSFYKNDLNNGFVAHYSDIYTCQNKPENFSSTNASASFRMSETCVKVFDTYNCAGKSGQIEENSCTGSFINFQWAKNYLNLRDIKSFEPCSTEGQTARWKANLYKIQFYPVSPNAGNASSYKNTSECFFQNDGMKIVSVNYKLPNFIKENFTVDFKSYLTHFTTVAFDEHLETEFIFNESFLRAISWENISLTGKKAFQFSISNIVKEAVGSKDYPAVNLPNHRYQTQKKRKLFSEVIDPACNASVSHHSIVKILKNLQVQFDLFFNTFSTAEGEQMTSSDLREELENRSVEIREYNATSVLVKLTGTLDASLVLETYLETTGSLLFLKKCNSPKIERQLTNTAEIYIGALAGMLFVGLLIFFYSLCRRHQKRYRQVTGNGSKPFQRTICGLSPDKHMVKLGLINELNST